MRRSLETIALEARGATQLRARGRAGFQHGLLAVLLAFGGPAEAEIDVWKCGSDDDCVNPDAPYCDFSSGSCYPCLVNDHCEIDEVCHQNACILACLSDQDCEAPTSYCSPGGVCFGCLDDSHCSGDEPFCLIEPDAGSCVECIIDEDCPEGTPWCKPGYDTCVECVEHFDCPEDQHCSQDACKPDICEPGALSCNDDNTWVLECDESGGRELMEKFCPAADCEDGACGDSGGTGSDTADSGETSSETGDDPGGAGESGATPLDDRGCACSSGDDSPNGVGSILLALLALCGLGRRTSRQRPRRARAS